MKFHYAGSLLVLSALFLSIGCNPVVVSEELAQNPNAKKYGFLVQIYNELGDAPAAGVPIASIEWFLHFKARSGEVSRKGFYGFSPNSTPELNPSNLMTDSHGVVSFSTQLALTGFIEVPSQCIPQICEQLVLSDLACGEYSALTCVGDTDFSLDDIEMGWMTVNLSYGNGQYETFTGKLSAYQVESSIVSQRIMIPSAAIEKAKKAAAR